MEDRYASTTERTIKIVPNPAVVLLNPASNPLAFCLPNNASAPPLKALAAFVLDGNIKTAIINKTDTMMSAINKTSYNGGPPLNTTINYSINKEFILHPTSGIFRIQMDVRTNRSEVSVQTKLI